MPIQIGLPGSVSYALTVQGLVYEPARVALLLLIVSPNQNAATNEGDDTDTRSMPALDQWQIL